MPKRLVMILVGDGMLTDSHKREAVCPISCHGHLPQETKGPLIDHLIGPVKLERGRLRPHWVCLSIDERHGLEKSCLFHPSYSRLEKKPWSWLALSKSLLGCTGTACRLEYEAGWDQNWWAAVMTWATRLNKPSAEPRLNHLASMCW